MFSIQLGKLKSSVLGIRKSLDWQNLLRGSVLPQIGETPAYGIDAALRSAMQESAPDRLSWQLQDHRYTVTALYASYEKFIDELVGAYITLIPRVWPSYHALPDTVRRQYRLGISQILSKWGPDSIYASIPEASIALGLVTGLNGSEYTLLSQALLTDSNNYRTDVLNKIFERIGISSAFKLACSEPEIVEFLTNKLSDQHTAETFLSSLIESRNKASHGETTQVASYGELIHCIDFIVLLCESLEKCLRDSLIIAGTSSGVTKTIGNVIHRWSGNVVGFQASALHTIEPGMQFYFGNDEKLKLRTVIKIELDKVVQQSLSVTPKMEISMQLDGPVESKAKAYLRLNI